MNVLSAVAVDGVCLCSGCESPVSDALLSDRDQLRLDVVRLLCSWCSPEGDTPLASSSGGGSLTPAGVKRQLLDQLDEEKGWDPTRPFDLQLVGAVSIRHVTCCLATRYCQTWMRSMLLLGYFVLKFRLEMFFFVTET